MFCSKCGTSSAEDAAFCAKCGSALQTLVASRDATSVALSDAAALRAPLPSSVAIAPQAFDEEGWRAAIGPKNTDYYLRRFRDQHVSGTVARWHWPAFFVTFYWMVYRKLWLPAAIYFFAPYVVFFAIGLVMGAAGASQASAGAVAALAYLVTMLLLPPLFANQLYFSKTQALVARHSRDARSRDAMLATLEAKGGTSRVAFILVLVFGTLSVLGILAAVALPAYQDYTKRAKVAEALVTSRPVLEAVGDHYQRTGSIPLSLDGLASEAQKGPYIAGMQIQPSNGVVELDLNLGANAGGGVIRFIPSASDVREVTWTCQADAALAKYSPQLCRQ